MERWWDQARKTSKGIFRRDLKSQGHSRLYGILVSVFLNPEFHHKHRITNYKVAAFKIANIITATNELNSKLVQHRRDSL